METTKFMNEITEKTINGVYCLDDYTKVKKLDPFVYVDEWTPRTLDEVIVTCRAGYFIAPLNVFFDVSLENADNLNKFILATKKCYNSPAMREHLFRYINYFCNYYDPDFEYISILFAIKTKVDRFDQSMYPVQAFFYDMERYILSPSMINKVKKMVEDNYTQKLDYTNIKSPKLQYTDDNAKLLHTMSIFMDLCIPLLTNYAYMHKISGIDDYLLAMYDKILHMDPSTDMYSKLYDTSYTNVLHNQRNNQGIWNKQDIRAIDVITHSVDSVQNIILNIIPKYTFDRNIIFFNYSSIRTNTKYKVTDIGFEFSYSPVSSSKRDDDSVSDFDNFEAGLIRMNESLYLQNKVNGQTCMRNIEVQFGPFDNTEIKLYTKSILIGPDGNYKIDSFQKQLVFLMFYRWFNDTQSIYSINRVEYIKLIIAAKKILRSKNMIILPYVISGKVEKLVNRKTINKKEKTLVESCPLYCKILEKYKNENIINNILSIIATIISSDFSIVDMDPTIHGKKLDTSAINVIIEEVEAFVLMC
jgi:hypothetical protein